MEGTRRRRANEDLSGDVADTQEADRDKELEARSSKGWTTFFLAFVVAAGLLVSVVVLLPSPIEPVAFSLQPPPAFVGPLEPNDKLTQAERVFENQLVGPESMVRDGDYIYTGTADGRVVSIYKGELRTLTRFGKEENCGSPDMEPTCGRPLGMRMGKDGYLLVVDAYLGIYKVNVATGDAHQVLSANQPLAGTLPKFLNDIEEGPDGMIYITESSTRWQRRHFMYCFLEGETSGRLVSYNPKTQEVKEIISGLAFANSVAISGDKSFLLVSETARSRILRYHLSGPKQGQTDIFADNLPGFPDNIRPSGRGTFWVGFGSIRRAEKFSLPDFAASRPWLRKLATKLMPYSSLISLVPQYGLLVEMDKDGNIIRSLHDPTGKQVPAISEAEEKNGVLYLGSYKNPFLSRVYLHKK